MFLEVGFIIIVCTANPNWGDIFESSKLKARTSLLARFSENRRSSCELWALKQHSNVSHQMGLAVVFKMSSELRFSKVSSIVIVFSKLRSELTSKNHGHTYEWGMSHAWMRHVTFMNEASHVHVWAISHMCMSWFERTFEWGMPRVCIGPRTRTFMCDAPNIHVTHINEPTHGWRGKGLQHLLGVTKRAFSFFYIFWNSDYRQRFPLNILKLGLSPEITWIERKEKIQTTPILCIAVLSKPSPLHLWLENCWWPPFNSENWNSQKSAF